MSDFNKVIVQGRLTRSPELTYTQGGSAIAKFGLAVNRRYKSGDEQKQEVCFIDVTVFGKRAETTCQYIDKGDEVIVDGRLQQDTWEKDGAKHSRHVVIAGEVLFGNKKKDQANG